MNFHHFFILIFNTRVTHRGHTIGLLAVTGLTLLFSLFLNRLDFSITGNDLIRKYQLSKIEKLDFSQTETIIVGDSSAGNAIDARLFSQLSGQKTENLALTGSWGVAGSVGMAKAALSKAPALKNIIIIHTLDIWGRPFARESVLELFRTREAIETLGLATVVAFYLNPKEILWHLRPLALTFLPSQNRWSIDPDNDYIVQFQNRYTNGRLAIDNNQSLNSILPSGEKAKELSMLNDFCRENNLNCILLNGPTIDSIANNSQAFFDRLQKWVPPADNVDFDFRIFSFNAAMMGDSADHIDPAFKREVTTIYFKKLAPRLRKTVDTAKPSDTGAKNAL
ncbi:MAG: hypothetical protein AB7E49_00645 [Campylobacterales bacterium]